MTEEKWLTPAEDIAAILQKARFCINTYPVSHPAHKAAQKVLNLHSAILVDYAAFKDLK